MMSCHQSCFLEGFTLTFRTTNLPPQTPAHLPTTLTQMCKQTHLPINHTHIANTLTPSLFVIDHQFISHSPPHTTIPSTPPTHSPYTSIPHILLYHSKQSMSKSAIPIPTPHSLHTPTHHIAQASTSTHINKALRSRSVKGQLTEFAA